MDGDKISKLIKEIRLKKNLTQKEFADIYNVTYQAVSKWENNKSIPDITLLKRICNDNNVTLDEMFDKSNDINKKKNKKNKYLIILFLMLLFIIALIIIFNDSDFEFKTINSKCDNFIISGSLAYNKNKSSIYISDINYCGQEDKTIYKKIECIIYEKNKNNDNIIQEYHSDNATSLKDFLSNFELKIDDYKYNCKDLTNNLYLKINAYISDNELTSYKIPLVLEDDCLIK